MRLVVVTEYCKSMSSQSGRQSQSDSVVLLICLKNSWALLTLRKGFHTVLNCQHFFPLLLQQGFFCYWGTCMYLLSHQGLGADTYKIQFKDRPYFSHIVADWSNNTHHGRHWDVLSASLIPHSNRQLEWEYLSGKQAVVKIGWGTIYITLSGNWVSRPPMQIDNHGLMVKGFPFAKVLRDHAIFFCFFASNNMAPLA